MKLGLLKRGTAALVMAAQEQAIRTNVIKAKIGKTQKNINNAGCGERLMRLFMWCLNVKDSHKKNISQDTIV